MYKGEGETTSGLEVIPMHFPRGVVSCFSEQNHSEEVLTPEELQITRHFEPPRRQSFINGRYCAHRCLQVFGEREQVTMDTHGAPVWPPRFIGSISHSKQLAGALMAKQCYYASVGLDIEEIGRIDRDLWQVLFVPTEQSFLRKLPTYRQQVFSTVLFSIKEAYFKMQFPITHSGLEPTDAEVIIDQSTAQIRLKDHLFDPCASSQSPVIRYHIGHSLVISYVLLVQHDVSLC